MEIARGNYATIVHTLEQMVNIIVKLSSSKQSNNIMFIDGIVVLIREAEGGYSMEV